MNTSKYKYKGYGICFDESESFSHVRKEGNKHLIIKNIYKMKVINLLISLFGYISKKQNYFGGRHEFS